MVAGTRDSPEPRELALWAASVDMPRSGHSLSNEPRARREFYTSRNNCAGPRAQPARRNIRDCEARRGEGCARHPPVRAARVEGAKSAVPTSGLSRQARRSRAAHRARTPARREPSAGQQRGRCAPDPCSALRARAGRLRACLISAGASAGRGPRLRVVRGGPAAAVRRLPLRAAGVRRAGGPRGGAQLSRITPGPMHLAHPTAAPPRRPRSSSAIAARTRSAWLSRRRACPRASPAPLVQSTSI